MSSLADEFAVAICFPALRLNENPIEAVGPTGITKMRSRLYAFFALKNLHPKIMAEDLASKLGAQEPQALIAYANIACRQKWWHPDMVVLTIEAINRVRQGMAPGASVRKELAPKARKR